MNFKFNLEKLVNMRGLALVLVAATCTTSLAGCGKKADCNIDGSHAHLYTNEQGYIRYIDKEYLTYEGYNRNDEYISIEGEENLYKFLDKKDLMRIDDNLEVIQHIQESNEDYTEYRYKYTYLQPIPHTMRVGKTTTTYFTYVSRTRYSWTSDPNHSKLTGETRLCHYTYVAYKVEKDEKGKYVLIPSENVDDLTTIMNEYPYINKNYVKVVTEDGLEADYEDGKQEDLSDEDKKRAEEYESTHSDENVQSEEKGKSLTKTK